MNTKLYFIIIVMILSVFYTDYVYGANVWDRPIFVFNETALNNTLNQLNQTFYTQIINLQSQVDNKLNITDQRYNDTQLILLVNTTLNNNKLDKTDQRYNDSLMIQNVNNTLSSKINDKLDKTDQRYNDTSMIQSVNTTSNIMSLQFYNKSEVDARIPLQYTLWFKNDSSDLIGYKNMSTDLPNLTSIVNIQFSSVTDGQNILNFTSANNTGFVFLNSGYINFHLDASILTGNKDSRLYFKFYIKNATSTSLVCTSENSDLISTNLLHYDVKCLIPRTDVNPIIDRFQVQVFVNVSTGGGSIPTITIGIDDNTASGVSLPVIRTTFVESDPIAIPLINTKLNITDQRYNDTLMIQSVNDSVWNNFLYYYNMTQIDNMFNAINSSVKQPVGIYLESNSTSFQVNESALNNTIRIISKIHRYDYNFTFNTTAGNYYNITSIPIQYLITEIKVIPTTLTNKYHFECTEYPSINNIIDKDRIKHTGIWDIEKNYGINSIVAINISDASINEQFIIQIIYLDNGVEP